MSVPQSGPSVVPEVRAATSADRVWALGSQAAAVLAERIAVPDLPEGLAQDVAADQVEARGDVAVGEDVRAEPGAGGRGPVGEGLGLRVVEAHRFPVQLRIEGDGK